MVFYRDEIFYRITKKQLVELFQAYENDDFENIASSSGSPGNGPRIVSYSASQQQDTSDRPYLILDARDPISYNTCHIAQSLNFPLAMMKRDQIIPELFSHRNREEHLIIVYCDDERISAEASKFLVDRGTNNIFLLSNGMVDFVWDYQEYVEGNIPYPPPKQQKTPTKNTRSKCVSILMLCIVAYDIFPSCFPCFFLFFIYRSPSFMS